MHCHGGVGIIARGKFLGCRHFLQIEHNCTASCEYDYLWFFGIKANTFEDTASFDEISLGGCLAQTVDSHYFILLCVIRADTHQVVSFCLLKFDMGHV